MEPRKKSSPSIARAAAPRSLEPSRANGASSMYASIFRSAAIFALVAAPATIGCAALDGQAPHHEPQMLGGVPPPVTTNTPPTPNTASTEASDPNANPNDNPPVTPGTDFAPPPGGLPPCNPTKPPTPTS